MLRLGVLIVGVLLVWSAAVGVFTYPSSAATMSSHAPRIASQHPAKGRAARKKSACEAAARRRKHHKGIQSCLAKKSRGGAAKPSAAQKPAEPRTSFSPSATSTSVQAPRSGSATGEGRSGDGSSVLEESSPVSESPAPVGSKGPVEIQPVETPTPFRFFSPTSFWNEPLPANAPLDPSSAAVLGGFDAEVAAEEDTEDGPAINTTKWSVPVYTVPADQPTVKVTLENASNTALQSAWDAVPLPPDAQPAAGTDKHLVVWQPSTDRLWEFWRLAHGAEGWQASWGGAIQNVSSNPGAYGPDAWPGAKPGWGASASSLSIAGGLITLEDLELGQINHALAIGIPDVRAGVYASPAERTDGKSTAQLSVPEGAHLRLDPNLDLAALHLPPLTLMLAEAAQRYGIFARDGGANVAFYAQDPVPTGTEPYAGRTGYFEGKSARELLASFPWSHLQLLKMELRSYP